VRRFTGFIVHRRPSVVVRRPSSGHKPENFRKFEEPFHFDIFYFAFLYFFLARICFGTFFAQRRNRTLVLAVVA
jgi:hypothetical protein